MQLSHGLTTSMRQSVVVNQQLQQAIVLLRMTNFELQNFIESQSEENPFVALTRQGPAPAPLPRSPSEARAGAADDWDRIAALPDTQDHSLYTFVATQIGKLNLSETDIDLASLFVDALEPTGWLGQSVEAIAARAGVDVTHAAAMLTRLQGLEPAGVFARSLAECLRLQAMDQDCLTPLLAKVLDNLPLLASADLTALARLCNTDLDGLRGVLRVIRGFDPKPGARFGGDPGPIRQPDLIVSRAADGGWQVELNRSTLPQVRIRENAARALADKETTKGATKGATGAVSSYVAERMSIARWLSRAVEHRNRTVLRVAEEILRRQIGFLDHGPSHLKPMILKEIATECGVHESTVSRVASGVMMATPHGTFPLKHFFTAALAGTTETGGSAGAVRHRLEQLIRTEPPGKPLTDDQLVQMLAAEGVTVARRTVAKYREMLHIPSVALRRRQALLSGRA